MDKGHLELSLLDQRIVHTSGLLKKVTSSVGSIDDTQQSHTVDIKQLGNKRLNSLQSNLVTF